jgi:group I intron endonuclease
MKNTKMTGIYCIRLKDKFYVGQSVNIARRFKEHKRLLLSEKHYSEKLLRSVKKYGIDSFSFEIIELCNEAILTEKEQYWIDLLDCFNSGFNCLPAAKSSIGFKHSDETKKIMSEKAKGKKLSEDHKAKIGESIKGKKYTSERLEKSRIAQKNAAKNLNPEKLKKRLNAAAEVNRGKHLSYEEKRKIAVLLLKSRLMNGKCKGYYFSKSSKKYISRIKVDGIEISIGSFKTSDDARNAFLLAAKKYYPEIEDSFFDAVAGKK